MWAGGQRKGARAEVRGWSKRNCGAGVVRCAGFILENGNRESFESANLEKIHPKPSKASGRCGNSVPEMIPENQGFRALELECPSEDSLDSHGPRFKPQNEGALVRCGPDLDLTAEA